jgi:hypothetical protein
MLDPETAIRLMLKGVKKRANHLGKGQYHLALIKAALLEQRLEQILDETKDAQKLSPGMLLLLTDVNNLAQLFKP